MRVVLLGAIRRAARARELASLVHLDGTRSAAGVEVEDGVDVAVVRAKVLGKAAREWLRPF